MLSTPTPELEQIHFAQHHFQPLHAEQWQTTAFLDLEGLDLDPASKRKRRRLLFRLHETELQIAIHGTGQHLDWQIDRRIPQITRYLQVIQVKRQFGFLESPNGRLLPVSCNGAPLMLAEKWGST
jgi:hypothetical protein